MRATRSPSACRSRRTAATSPRRAAKSARTSVRSVFIVVAHRQQQRHLNGDDRYRFRAHVGHGTTPLPHVAGSLGWAICIAVGAPTRWRNRHPDHRHGRSVRPPAVRLTTRSGVGDFALSRLLRTSVPEALTSGRGLRILYADCVIPDIYKTYYVGRSSMWMRMSAGM